MKRIALICIIAALALGLFGCTGGGDQEEAKELTKREAVMVYNSLKGAYIQTIDYYEARQNNKITKFDWRVMAASARNQSKRMADMTKSSEDPVAQHLTIIANDIVSLVDELEGQVDHGTTPDLSYKEKIENELEELNPEIEKIKDEVIKEKK